MGFLYIVFIMLRCVPSLPTLSRTFIIKASAFFKGFFPCIYWDDCVIFVCVWTWFVLVFPSLCTTSLSHLFVLFLVFFFFFQCRSFEITWNSDAYLPPNPVWLENFAPFFYSIFKAKMGSWKQQTDEFCFLIHSVSPRLLPGALRPLIFKFSIETCVDYGHHVVDFCFVFLVVLCVLIIMAWYFVFIVSGLWTPFSINNSAINNSSYFF